MRRRMTSCTPAGRSRCPERTADASSCPRVMRSWTTSVTKKALPSVAFRMAWTASGAGARPHVASTYCPTSSAVSPVSVSRWLDRARSPRTRAAAAACRSSVSRYVPSTRSRCSRSSRATKVSSKSDSLSAQCRSSSTITSSSVRAIVRRNIVTASKSRKRATSGSSVSSVAATTSGQRVQMLGTSRVTCGPSSPSSVRSRSGGVAATYARNAWIHGQ